jgi:hypothetical protein
MSEQPRQVRRVVIKLHQPNGTFTRTFTEFAGPAKAFKDGVVEKILLSYASVPEQLYPDVDYKYTKVRSTKNGEDTFTLMPEVVNRTWKAAKHVG